MKRRTLLQRSMVCGALGVAASAGLLIPGSVLAAWPKTSFDAKELDNGLINLFASTSNSYVASDKIYIKTPDIAENGAVVPITVKVSVK